MLALGEAFWGTVITAILSGATLVTVAIIGRNTKARQQETHRLVTPENGHESIGEGLQAIEEQLEGARSERVEIDTRLSRHIGSVATQLEEGRDRFERIDEKLTETLHLAAEGVAFAKKVDTKLQEHLDEVTPYLIERRKKEEGT
ncbi:MAG: hypothetical protein ACRDH7_07480 [Actinomycetota bacterium]